MTDGKEEAKKESYVNDAEARALVEYYIENIQEDSEFVKDISAARAEGSSDPSLLVISPYRTQAHLVRSVIVEKSSDMLQEKMKKPHIAKGLKGKLFQKIDDVCCLEDIVSGGTHPAAPSLRRPGYTTVLISLCRTQDFATAGGQVLNEPEIVKFLLTRCSKRLIVFGRPESLNTLWSE